MTVLTQERKEWLAYAMFWSWNLVFLAFMVFGFAPRLLPELLLDVRTGLVPANYLVYGLVLSLIPLLAVILGLTVLRRAPGRLFALGYVVEGPLMLVLVIRFFLIRQGTPSLLFLLVVAWLGMAAFLWHMLDPQIERRRPWVATVRLIGLTLMLLTSLYAALWIAFYAVPLVGMAFDWLVRTLTHFGAFLEGLWRVIKDLFTQGLAWIPLTVLGFILLFYTATLFALAPLVIPWLSWRAWWQSLQAQVKRAGWGLPVVLILLTVAITGALFVVSNRQPQKLAFDLLAEPPATQQEAQDLLKQGESIRAGLLNAYLAPFRYISAVGEVRHVSDLYVHTFQLTAYQAANVQLAYENVARPLLYDPVQAQDRAELRDNLAFQREPQEAAQLYQQFFDTPIADGERQAIVDAVRSTWSGSEAERAWQSVDDREVYLVQQEINIEEHGDWAEVELLEVFQNQTADRQEVIYYFSLPESAVLTGVWLGESPDRESRFAFQVAPRGAAQAVYRNEVRRNIDPALLEQIGPRQYRLRAFPVPPVITTWNEENDRRTVKAAPPFYLWLTYRTLAAGDAWPLPRLAEKLNVYWDADTVRLLNGVARSTSSAGPADEQSWLPEAVPASQPVVPVAHRVDFPGGESVLALPAAQASLPTMPAGLRLAVVLDRSYSMNVHEAAVADVLAHLQEITAQTPADLYLTASPFRGEQPARVSLQGFNTAEVLFFGGQNAADLLAQFVALRAGREYDAVIVLTDASGYELGASEAEIPALDMPVWLVHLEDRIPLGYDDQTLEAIQSSGGGVAGELQQALDRLALDLSRDPSGTAGGVARQDLLDGYRWVVLPADQAASEAPQAVLHGEADGFVALAARQVILAEMRRQQGALQDLETLDRLHALAQQYGIVTPYSSMIVLVNNQQQRLLDQMSELGDRFEREYETLAETTPATRAPLTGVPEPEEWLLLGLAVALLLWYAYRQRFAYQRG